MAKLIQKLEEIQVYARVNDGLDFEAVDPSMIAVEEDVLVYYIGGDLFLELAASYGTALAEMTPRVQKIFPFAQRLVSCLGVYNAISEIEVGVSSDGITRREGSESKTAFGGQVVRLKETFGNRGYSALDQILKVLETYEQDYPEWQNAEYYSHKSGLFFTSSSDFNRHENIGGSPLTFKNLWTFIRDVQQIQISSALPIDMLEEIQEEIDSDSLSQDNRLLVERFLKPAIAKLTIEQALIELPVQLDASGGVVVNQLEMNTNDNRSRKKAPDSMIEKKMFRVQGKGRFFLAQMAEFLNENASGVKYTLWYNSDKYDEPLSKKIKDNSLDSSERKIYRA